uniref:Beta-glucuronidase C-terminal domain-containing protein n=1 Tax=Moniliophthora roreri TaxID=221103 RepID=A0A0W0F2I2_MONRR
MHLRPLYFLLSFVRFASCIGVDVFIPTTPPPTSQLLSPGLIAFSIEQDRWPEWAQSTFANNTFNNLRRLTGELWIRIGANSQDRTLFDSTVEVSTSIPRESTPTNPYPEAANITVGDGFYALVSQLPPGTHTIFGINFGMNNISIAVSQADSLMRAFRLPEVRKKGITLDFLEIGNEVNYYGHPDVGTRDNATWSPREYVPQWNEFASAIIRTTGITGHSRTRFFGASFGGSNTFGFTAETLFDQGYLESQPGALVTLLSQHRYSGSFCQGSASLLQDLMDKGTIKSNLTMFYEDIVQTRRLGLSYILGETNSYSCHGAPNVSNTAGAALWSLTYSLAAACVGIERVHFHQGIGFRYNFIQPVALDRSILDGSPLPSPIPPHVQPGYYAGIIAAEVIGRSLGLKKIVELEVDDQHVAGFAVYDSSRLSKAVFVNLKAYIPNEGSNPERGTVNVDLYLGEGEKDAVSRNAEIKRLRIGSADDTSGLTWGGQTYETEDGLVSGEEVVETVDLGAGFEIQDTEAVVITFSSG